jgi:hypothetical protein
MFGDDEQMRTNIHALSWNLNYGLRVQAIKVYVTYRAATGSG